MKKVLFAIAAFTALLAGCTKDKESGSSGAPIAFSATFEEPKIVMGTSSKSYAWTANDQVGVFINATREMLFEAEQTGSATTLSSLMADIPADFGSMAYAYAPAAGSPEAYFRTPLQVPAVQQFAAGRNANVLNMAAIAPVVDAAAAFHFKQLGAILELGLKSPDTDINLSKMKIELVNPSAGKYLVGTAKIDFTLSEPELAANITGGSNVVTVEFPGGLMLASTPVYVPVGVLPFSSDGGGMQVTVYDAENNACVLPAIWTGENEISENGALTVGRGARVIDLLDDILYRNFNRPEPVTLKIIDDKTGGVGVGLHVDIYEIEGNTEVEVGSLTSDASGLVKTALNPGVYRAYCAYDAKTDAKWNSLDFTVESRGDNKFDFPVCPILFADDFDWITPEMGGNVVLKDLYESIDPPVANTANEVVWASGVGAAEVFAQKGWTLSTWVYIRPGSVRVGKKNAVGTITTPKLGTITTSAVRFSLVARPWHVVSANAWRLEEAQLEFKIIGGGSFEQGQTVTTYLSNPMTSDAPTSPLKRNYFDLTIYDATPETQVAITNKLPAGISATMYRVMIDQVKIVEIY